MPLYALLVEYDGAPFVGWQRQANGLSVQEAVESAIRSLTGGAAPIQAAGRTDAGVHAKGQVVHVDLERDWRGDRLRDALNAHLRLFPVAVVEAEQVAVVVAVPGRHLTGGAEHNELTHDDAPEK